MKMPNAETYERELKYMPYRKSLERVADIVCSESPLWSGIVLDVMCGTGDLLKMIKGKMRNTIVWTSENMGGRIRRTRKDYLFYGMDVNQEYVDEAKKIRDEDKDPHRGFEVGDVLTWNPRKEFYGYRWETFQVVTCTGALHHIPYEKQEEVIKRMSEWVSPHGIAVISDCYIDDYTDETERKVATAKLGYEYLAATIRNGAPEDVVRSTAEIIENDVMLDGEFKTSLAKREPLFKKYFGQVRTEKTWPSSSTEYGDYITVLRK